MRAYTRHFDGMLRIVAILALVSMAAWAQAPSISSVVNSQDYSFHYCPGALVFLYGANFGSSMSALSLTVGGKPAFIAGFTSTLIEAQIPFELSPGPTTLVLTVAGSALPGVPLNLTATAPAFATFDSTGSGTVTMTTPAGAVVTSQAPANPGDTVLVFLSGLGVTNPPTPTGPAAKAAPPAATPTLTVGGQNASITSAVLAPGFAGLYQVAFKVPAGVQGDAPIVLTIGGAATSAQNPLKPLTIPIFGITYIENNASFASPGTASAGAIVSLFGNGFGTTSQTTGFPATTFQGVSVTFNGTPAPLFHLSTTPAAKATATTNPTIGASQIDLLVPYELPATGVVQVAVKTASATSPNYALSMAAATPGMYYIQDPSTATRFNILAQFNQTAWLDMPASMATALKIPGACAANNYSALSLCGQPAGPLRYRPRPHHAQWRCQWQTAYDRPGSSRRRQRVVRDGGNADTHRGRLSRENPVLGPGPWLPRRVPNRFPGSDRRDRRRRAGGPEHIGQPHRHAQHVDPTESAVAAWPNARLRRYRLQEYAYCQKRKLTGKQVFYTGETRLSLRSCLR